NSESDDNTSSFVSASSVHVLSRTACFNITRSSQPVRRRRFVLVPNSAPRSTSMSPTSSPSNSSVGNGPLPTRVWYALTSPTTRWIASGPTPAPVQTPPATGLLDVTNGYVPWSRSRYVACAPSNNTHCWASSASCTRCTESSMSGASRGTIARYVSASCFASIGRRLYTFASTPFFSRNARSSFSRKIFGSSRSCTRMPTRNALSAYAGPMPRFVVPSLFLPRYRSVTRSSSWWYGMIRCALPDSRNKPVSTPFDPSMSISSSRTAGSTTTPLPITGVTHGYRTPLGTSCSLKPSPSTTSVWPALCPP